MTKTQTTNKFDRDAYVDKVRKLLAKAEGASTSEEAETFFAKAQDLMTKWEIAEAEVAAAKLAAGATTDWKIVERHYPLSSYSPNQDSAAMQCVARAMGLRGYTIPYVRGHRKAEAVILGTAEDLDRFEMMWASVSLQMTRFMKEGEDPRWNRNQQRTYRLGFKVGFGTRVGERIAVARDRGVKSTDLVLRGKADAIEQAMPDNLRRRAMRVNGDAHDAGRAAADRADISDRARVRSARGRKAVTA
jgi:hypothetical protein